MKLQNCVLSLLLSLTATLSLAQSTDPVNQPARDRLLEQLRYGETIYRDDLVEDATERLLRLNPDDPQGLLARVYLATRRNDAKTAEQYLQQLAKIAPESPAYAQAKALIELNQENNQKQLAQARLFAAVGKLEDARKTYDNLFKGVFPTVDLAVEYWKLRGRDPASRELADNKLKALLQQYPRHPQILLTLANYSFDADRPDEGLKYLHELAKNSRQLETAAAREYEYLATLPVTDETARMWSDFLTRYAGTTLENDARGILASQQALLGDPIWRAGQRGIALVDAGKGAEALPLLQAAVKAYPKDPQFLGNLGLAYLRSNNREMALKYFQLAKESEPRIDSAYRWVSLIESTEFWMTLNQASQALERGNHSLAQKLFLQALEEEPGNVFALVGLGDVALAQHRNQEALKYYRQALDKNPADATALNGIARYLATLEPLQALELLQGFPAGQQKYLAVLKRQLQIAQYEAEATRAQQQGRWQDAAELLAKAQQLDLSDPWLSYRLANALRMAGKPDEAIAAYQRHLKLHPGQPASIYAYGLLLESMDQWKQGIQALATLSKSQWTQDMAALNQRLESRLLIDKARQYYDRGDVDTAIVMLEEQPQSVPLELQIAEWSLLHNRFQQALKTYEEVLSREPDNIDARLGVLEVRAAQGDTAIAGELTKVAASVPQDDVSAQRRLALLWAQTEDTQQAKAILQNLVQNQGTTDPLIYRDLARLLKNEDPQQALDMYRKAMLVAGMAEAPPSGEQLDNESFTSAMLTPDQDPGWLYNSIRNDASALYQANNPTLSVGVDVGTNNNGTPGLSQLTAITTMAQMNMPLLGGNGFARAEYISLNAGSLQTDANGNVTQYFGTCILDGQTASGSTVSLPGCSNVPSQSAQGIGMALGWQNERWGFDIGHMPTEFAVSNWTGGVHMDADVGEFGLRLTVSRRPMTNSLLSYAGTTDPRTGMSWGGVVATGAALGLSWDQGRENGFWANISFHKLTGKNVEDNQRFRVMGGYYRRLINNPNEQFTVGVNAMYWQYDKDLSQYTFGQGGYYSPQMYASIGLPISYARRWQNWSVALDGSISFSHSRTNNQEYYPLLGAMSGPVNQLLGMGATYPSIGPSNLHTGSSGNGIGYRIRASVERRLGAHWVAGGLVEIQRSLYDEHSPNRFMIYLRYFFQPWKGDLQLNPRGMTPYAEFN